jgi:hypothetical protein
LFQVCGDRRVEITGRIDLRAKVGGQVTFNNAIVTATEGKVAVQMDSADVAGSVFFRNGTAITGQVDLRAKVGGQVTFNNATVTATKDSVAASVTLPLSTASHSIAPPTTDAGAETYSGVARPAHELDFKNPIENRGVARPAVRP